MRRFLGLLLLASAGLHSQPRRAVYQLKSDHFVIYAEDTRLVRRVLNEFERAQAFFTTANLFPPAVGAAGKPLRLFALPTETAFDNYRLNPSSTACFISNEQFDGVVLSPAAQAETRTAIHEYVHLRIQSAGLKLPMWLNEGLAEFYSTLHSQRSGKVTVGAALPGHLRTLSRSWTPLAALIKLSPEMSASRHAEFTLGAYAECWAAAHMLLTAEPWRTRSSEFIESLQRNGSTERALQEVYSISPAAWEQAVQAYVHRWRGREISYDVPRLQEVAAPETNPADPFTVDFSLGASIPDPGRRYAAMQQLSQDYPGRPEPFEVLAVLMTRQGGASALPALLKAFENGSKDHRALMNLASLLLNQRDERCPRVLSALLEQAPEHSDARMLLGQWHLMHHEYRDALQTLEKLNQPPSGKETVYYEAIAVSAANLGLRVRARAALVKLHACALTDEQRRRMNTLESMVGR